MEDGQSHIFMLKRTNICRQQQQQKSILHGCKVSQYNLERHQNYKCILRVERYPLALGFSFQYDTIKTKVSKINVMISEGNTEL